MGAVTSGASAVGSSHADDLELARRAAAGDPEARRALVLGLMQTVRDASRWVLRGDVEAEDVAQSAMIRILGSVGKYRGEGPLAAWASRITVWTAMASLRRSRASRVVPFRGERDRANEPPAAAAVPGFPLRWRLARAMDRLKEDRRIPVVLRFVYGYSLEEIAEETGAPLNTVKDRLRIGRAELREAVLRDPVLREFVGGSEP